MYKVRNSTKTKKLIANTGVLYCRMLITMILSFYTTRIVLEALGVNDFGLCNVISSVCTMFSFLSGALSSAASRYYSFYLGQGEQEKFRQTFSILLELYCMLGGVVLVLSETMGLWIINHKIVISPAQVQAAQIFFQMTVFVLIVRMLAIPLSGAVIAREDMGIYAALSIFDAAGKLGGVFLLFLASSHRLEIYGFLQGGLALLYTGAYGIICCCRYRETRFRFFWSRTLAREILQFSGWQLWGATAVMAGTTLVNILLNNYSGVVANAARGIAVQVNGGLSAFTQNFLTAVNPQIVKSWSGGDVQRFQLLVYQSSKISFFLLWLVACPILLELNWILNIWLKDVPPYTVAFTRLIIISLLIDSFSYPLMVAAGATGRIALYQFVVGGILIMVFPISWFIVSMGGNASSPMVVGAGCSIAAFGARIVILHHLCSWRISHFLRTVVCRAMLVGIGSFAAAWLLQLHLKEGWGRLFAVGSLFETVSILLICQIGFTQDERQKLRGVFAESMPRAIPAFLRNFGFKKSFTLL